MRLLAKVRDTLLQSTVLCSMPVDKARSWGAVEYNGDGSSGWLWVALR